MFIKSEPDFKFQKASDKIKEALSSSNPCMVARFGCYELSCVRNYVQAIGNQIMTNVDSLKIKVKNYELPIELSKAMENNAGFFPCNYRSLKKFSLLMLRDMQQVDILGSWLEDEIYFSKELSNSVSVRLPDLEPYYHKNPWSEILVGKTILVIHPFSETIKKQFLKKAKIFDDKRILPDFELITLKAVQSIAGNGKYSGHKNWFSALNFMKKEIDNLNFDIAIIGCGAYGFPLAAHIKRTGKKAVHLGGATQILFGIKGKRWEEHELIGINGKPWHEQGKILKLMNDYWTRPSMQETPANSNLVENNCYW